MLKEIKRKNPYIPIRTIDDSFFKKYGRPVLGYDFSEAKSYISTYTSVPQKGNIYVASDSTVEKMEIYEKLRNNCFGGIDIQIGYCNGNNSSLGGLEYHKCSEVIVAVTDLILLLGKIEDIKNNTYDSRKVEAFYLKEGEAIELYNSTLHFAPCKVNEKGFKAIIILFKNTNLDLEEFVREVVTDEDTILFKKNKWLLVHEEEINLVKEGAHVGICGENIRINL